MELLMADMKKQWNEKRYHSLDYELKTVFGEKLYKISLDAGMTCPNRGRYDRHPGMYLLQPGRFR